MKASFIPGDLHISETTDGSRDELRRTAIRELLDGFFDGSEEELVRFLGSAEASAKAAAAAHPTAEERIDTVLL